MRYSIFRIEKRKKKKRRKEENFPKNSNKSAHSRKVKILIHLESLYQPTLIIEPNPFTTAPKRRLYFNPPLPCFLKQYYFIEHCDSPHRIDQNPDLSKIPSRSPTLSIPIFIHLTTRHRPPNYPKYSFQSFRNKASASSLESRFIPTPKGLHTPSLVSWSSTERSHVRQQSDGIKCIPVSVFWMGLKKLIGRKIWKRERERELESNNLKRTRAFVRNKRLLDAALPYNTNC